MYKAHFLVSQRAVYQRITPLAKFGCVSRRSNSSNSESSSRPPFNKQPSFKLTQAPNPNWTLGEGLSDGAVGGRQWKEEEERGWKSLYMDRLDGQETYKVLTSAVTPRPVAFVSSLSASGVPNLAPFSYFSMVAHNPPLISIAFTLSRRKPKDTRENIKATREFVVNIISEPFVEAANSCSIEAPEDVDEWIVSGLTREPSTLVNPPRVKESAVNLECELYHFFDITPPDSDEVTNTLILGRIKMMHIRNSVLTEDGLVDPAKLKAISRLGGTTYARMGEGFEIPRPGWRALQPTIEKMMQERKKAKI